MNESAIHALWQCKSLDEVWHAVPWGSSMKGNQYLNFMELFHHCNLSLPLFGIQLFAVTTWSIWYRQNCQRLNQPTDPINQLLARAQRLLLDFLAAQESPNHPTG